RWSMLRVGAGLLLFSSPAIAGELPTAYRCDFHGGQFNRFEVAEGFASEPANGMSLTFTNLNLAAGAARLIGNAGTEEVWFAVGTHALQFVEFTGAGNVTVTSIYQFPSAHGFPA